MMDKRFKVGDHVTWNSEAGHVSGNRRGRPVLIDLARLNHAVTSWGVEITYLTVPNRGGGFTEFEQDADLVRRIAEHHHAVTGSPDVYGPVYSRSGRGNLKNPADWVGEDHEDDAPIPSYPRGYHPPGYARD